MIYEGRTAMFVMFCLLTGLYLWSISNARKGVGLQTRRVPGLDALDEGLGRAAEMGRPVHYTMGLQNFEAQTFASMEILKYAAAQCAKLDVRIIATNYHPAVHPVIEEVVRGAYMEAGRPDAYRADDVRYLSDNQLAYTSGVIAILEREKVAVNLLFGPFYAESLIFAEAGHAAGAMQISGTANTHQLPFLVAACDYTLIGEEMFAAGAYLSKNPVLTGSLMGQELGKYIAVALMTLGAILATFKITFLKDILSK